MKGKQKNQFKKKKWRTRGGTGGGEKNFPFFCVSLLCVSQI